MIGGGHDLYNFRVVPYYFLSIIPCVRQDDEASVNIYYFNML